MSMRSEIIAVADGVAALANRNFADEAPEDTPFPYTTMLKDLSLTPRLIGDSQVSWFGWLGQLDLWQERANEDDAIVIALRNGLDGLAMTAGLRLRVRQVTRVPDPNFEIVHHAFTLATPVPR